MALSLGSMAAVAVATTAPLFETLRWTVPGAELEALSYQPETCLNYEPDAEPIVQAGEALFNSPNMLGGQAAKAGLSCASCHVNGRDNPLFLLAGVSDIPGTADVTSSFFSAARSNRRFDPAMIPDLAMPGKVSRDSLKNELQPFIRDLIVEEFSGEEPSSASLEALAAYVGAIKTCTSGEEAIVSRRLNNQLAIINGALVAASKLANKGDPKEAGLLVASARHQLGLVSERYSGAKFKPERALLLKASLDLQHIANTSGSGTNFGQALADWQSRFDKGLAKRLFRTESLSLYNPERLRTLVAPQRKKR